MIELKHLSKKFGARWALRDLNLQVGTGEIYGLLGHNGAGKSTTIGMLLGQVWPTEGQASIGGHEVISERKQALRKTGAIFETPAFYDYLSGRRNLEILSSYTASTPAAKIREVVEWVGLSGRENSLVRTYSHGMRARLALAQALLPGPELLILDEPGNGLDPEGIHELRHTILRLRRELNLTILLSSHLLNEVEQLCTRIAVLNRGRLVFEGSLADTKQTAARIRLRTNDFAASAQSLSAAEMIFDQKVSALASSLPLNVEERSGERMPPASSEGLIGLRPGIQTSDVVRHLVEKKFSVFEVTPETDTLEDFYLRLIKTEDAQEAESDGNFAEKPFHK